MKHPTATAHRIIEAFSCCTCVPRRDRESPVLFSYGSMWHMLLIFVPYFRLQVCNFFPLPYSRNPTKSVRKWSRLCHRTYPNGLRETPRVLMSRVSGVFFTISLGRVGENPGNEVVFFKCSVASLSGL